jgi:hypothetical protein
VNRKPNSSWLGALGLAALVGGCAATDAGGAGTRKTPNAFAVPPNYRKVVARYFVANVQTGKTLKAQISRPGVWSARSSLVGGPRPIVCVLWRAQGPIIEQDHALGFMFENGKVSETFNPQYANPAAGGYLGAALLNAATCGKLSYRPFREIMRPR